MGQYVAHPHRQQTKNQLQTDIDQRGNIPSVARQRKRFQRERRKRRESTQDPDKQKKPRLGGKRRPRLRQSRQKTDNQAAQRIYRQGTVGKPRIIENSMHPGTHSIAQDPADETTHAHQDDSDHSCPTPPSKQKPLLQFDRSRGHQLAVANGLTGEPHRPYFFRIMGSKAPPSQSGRANAEARYTLAASAILGNSTLGDIYKRLLFFSRENAILYCSESGNP